MKIVWFSWKDVHHPRAGGAEAVSWQIMLRLARAGHSVKLITALYSGSKKHESIEGIEIIRTGNALTVYIKACFLFRRKLTKWPNIIIDEMNTIPFASGFYSRKKTVLLTYQLARRIWFFQAPFPVSIIGYVLEPLYLFALSRRYRIIVTESESTRQDLTRYGFAEKNIGIFRVGTDLQPLANLKDKKDMHSVLVLGSLRPMKRTLSAVKSFEVARDKDPALQLTIAGDTSGSYATKVLKYTAGSRHANAITVTGRVSSAEKTTLMRQATVILVTSIKEGWGLIVTEANGQGTPAIAFDVDGLRDSIKDHETGLLIPSGNEKALGHAIDSLLNDEALYSLLRNNAWESSKQYTFDNSYADFLEAVDINNDSRN